MPIITTRVETVYRGERHGVGFRDRRGWWHVRMDRPVALSCNESGGRYYKAPTFDTALQLAFEDYREAEWYPAEEYEEIRKAIFTEGDAQ